MLRKLLIWIYIIATLIVVINLFIRGYVFGAWMLMAVAITWPFWWPLDKKNRGD